MRAPVTSLTLLAAAALLGSACNSGGTSTETPAPAAPTEAAAAPAAAAPEAAAPAETPPAPPAEPPAPAVTPGDTCAAPLPLALANGAARASGTLEGFTNTIGDPIQVTGYSWTGHDVFYALTAEPGTEVTITLDDKASFDGGVYVLTDCGNPVASVIAGLDTTPTRALTFTVPPGTAQPMIVVVDAWQGAGTGTYDLTVATRAPGAASAGDTCANAVPLSFTNGVATATGSLAGFTNTIGDRIEVTGYSWSGSDVFYTFDAGAGDVVTITLDDQGTFDGGVYLLRDCANPVASVFAGLDTTPSTPLNTTIVVEGRITLVVDAWAGATAGQYTLTVAKSGGAVAPGSLCTVGNTIQVYWGSTWYDATVKATREDGQCYIGYDGWADSWDEWVGADRMRPRG